ncbi:MAG: hypothetical protein RSB05_05755 [Clostridiales bacterium]
MAEDKEIIKQALMKRAIGYDYEEKEVTADKAGKPQKVKVIHKHLPPDISAIKEVIKEMNRGRW